MQITRFVLQSYFLFHVIEVNRMSVPSKDGVARIFSACTIGTGAYLIGVFFYLFVVGS